jgi:hypothetical protein
MEMRQTCKWTSGIGQKELFEENTENAFIPRKLVDLPTNGTIRKCFPRAFQ